MLELLVVDLGRSNYKETWDLQKSLHRLRVENDIPDTLLIVEHDPVITIGKSGKDSNLKVPEKLLKERGIDYYHIERGGDVTYHGPGQVVGYLIFNIRDGLIGIRPFIEHIEESIISVLADFGIDAHKQGKMIGVWTEQGKICSIGVAVKRWVSFHGFALNVNTDLKFFDMIIPCGIPNVNMVSMQSLLDREVEIDKVKKSLVDNFAREFKKRSYALCPNPI